MCANKIIEIATKRTHNEYPYDCQENSPEFKSSTEISTIRGRLHRSPVYLQISIIDNFGKTHNTNSKLNINVGGVLVV